MTQPQNRPPHDEPDEVAAGTRNGADAAAPAAGAELAAGAEPADTPQPAWSVELTDHLTATRASIAEFTQWRAAEADRAAARERVIDRQHEEIERLRSMQRSDQLRPTVTDLYRLRNDLLREAAKLPAEMTGADVADLLRSYADTVVEALERCGVTVSHTELGAPFVAGRHQVARTVEVDDPESDATIAAVVQDGYAEIGGTIVAPARIVLNRCVVKPGAAATEELAKEATR